MKWQSEEYHSIFGIGDPLPSHFICSDEKRNDIYKIADYFYMVYDYDHLIVLWLLFTNYRFSLAFFNMHWNDNHFTAKIFMIQT